jgi:hypothetical protein
VPEILDILNAQAEGKFKELVESGGEKLRDHFPRVKTNKKLLNIGFDTEDDSKGNVHLLVFYDGVRYYTFHDRDTALFWLIFSEFDAQMVIVWCVNTEYDLNNFQWGEHRQFLIKRLYNKSRYVMGTLAHRRTIRFYDIINYYSLSAEKVGALYGIKKLHFDFTRRKDKQGKVVVTKKEITYCQRDTQIAWKAGEHISGMFTKFDIPMSATIASGALQIYLRHFDNIGLSGVCLSRYMVDQDLIYQSYCGGRVECFGYGVFKGNMHYYDINSLYPSVMLKYQYPNPTTQVVKRRTADIANGIIRCRVKIPSRTYLPSLPVRHKGKLLFPVGTFDGTWIVAELNNAINNGAQILKVYESYEWMEVCDLFSEFVLAMYEQRQKAKHPADGYFYKVVMNSLYGKFAEKRRATKYIPLEQGGVFDPIVYDMAQVTDEYLPFHNNVIISSYVTAYGRITLFNLMKKILDKGCKLLYCDTDSVIFQGDCSLTTSSDLGGLKSEANIAWAEFLGAKYYRYTTTDGTEYFVCKGVPKAYQAEMFTAHQATYNRPIRYREALRRKLQANVWVPFTKMERMQYDKRRVLPDGRTLPVIINQ